MAGKCIVLVPVASMVEPQCELGLQVLEHHGYKVRRMVGCAAIDFARSKLASEALAQGYDELMWIDSDMVFDPNDIDKLRSHNLPISCALAAKKGVRALNCHAMPGTKEVVF